jgi:hypothetical protein
MQVLSAADIVDLKCDPNIAVGLDPVASERPLAEVRVQWHVPTFFRGAAHPTSLHPLHLLSRHPDLRAAEHAPRLM